MMHSDLSSTALSLLHDGELCTVIYKGKQRDVRWSPENWCFFFTDCTHPMQNTYCDLSSVEEWWPASVPF